jgi:SAM-dependent methyltransferase
MTFKDHFSGHAAVYASFRPTYPAALFDFVTSLTPGRTLAWDCATGNGQAAVGLADSFAHVIATDASAAQLEHATPHPKVEYRQAPAEDSGIAAGTVDLITVATAVHWFDFDRFYAEARRVLAPGGALAVWAYNLARVSPEVDVLIDHLAKDVVGAYWPPERKWVDDDYRDLPFPFAEVATPHLWIEAHWDLQRLLDYFQTWSSTVRYRQATGVDPVAAARDGFAEAWGDPGEVREVRWPVMMRAGML